MAYLGELQKRLQKHLGTTGTGGDTSLSSLGDEDDDELMSGLDLLASAGDSMDDLAEGLDDDFDEDDEEDFDEDELKEI